MKIDGKEVHVLDSLCQWRTCLRLGEERGVFPQGVGYRRPEGKLRLVCLTRDCHGCPHPLPAPDAEKVRCCPSPDLADPKKGSRPFRQRCRTCGKWHEGWSLQAVVTLPKYPAVKCKHRMAKKVEWAAEPTWLCHGCSLWFDHEPKPHEKGRENA